MLIDDGLKLTATNRHQPDASRHVKWASRARSLAKRAYGLC